MTKYEAAEKEISKAAIIAIRESREIVTAQQKNPSKTHTVEKASTTREELKQLFLRK